LNRSQPILPMMPGTPERRSHDYTRHGTTSLFAALDTLSGSVITSLHRRHRAVEFKKFLERIDSEVPDDLDVHLILDNYATHKTPTIKRWLLRHPRFHLHFTPTGSSWLNLVERWFARPPLVGRGSHDYYGHSVAIGLAPRRRSRVRPCRSTPTSLRLRSRPRAGR
jgi:transposase